MNGFLVLGRTNLDDVPLALFASRAAASRFANKATTEGVHELAVNVMGVDHAGIINVGVVEFRKGRPVGEIDLVKPLAG